MAFKKASKNVKTDAEYYVIDFIPSQRSVSTTSHRALGVHREIKFPFLFAEGDCVFSVSSLYRLNNHAIFLRRSPILLFCLGPLSAASARRCVTRLLLRRVHMGHAHSPVFSAPPVLIHISKPEKRLIDSRGLFVYSVNRFHFGTPFMPEICERLCELVIYILSADSAD
jgi:hypothetical protein